VTLFEAEVTCQAATSGVEDLRSHPGMGEQLLFVGARWRVFQRGWSGDGQPTGPAVAAENRSSTSAQFTTGQRVFGHEVSFYVRTSAV
jgi:hypothetical protein